MSQSRTHGMFDGARSPAAVTAEVERASMHGPLLSRQQATMLRMLVRMREAAGLKQTTLADRLGITQSEVSKFERGERALDVLRLRAWLLALGVAFPLFAEALDQELDRLLAGA